MKQADNDNTDTWISLAALTANVVRYLSSNEKNDVDANDKRNPGDAPKDRVPDNAADIERRVRDILAMENRLKRKRI